MIIVSDRQTLFAAEILRFFERNESSWPINALCHRDNVDAQVQTAATPRARLGIAFDGIHAQTCCYLVKTLEPIHATGMLRGSAFNTDRPDVSPTDTRRAGGNNAPTLKSSINTTIFISFDALANQVKRRPASLQRGGTGKSPKTPSNTFHATLST